MENYDSASSLEIHSEVELDFAVNNDFFRRCKYKTLIDGFLEHMGGTNGEISHGSGTFPVIWLD